MIDSSEIALCLNCCDDLISKTYNLDEFFCIPITALTKYYEWPTLEDEVTRFSNLHVALNKAHDTTHCWMRLRYRAQLPSRRHKFCVALSGISPKSAHSLYLLRPDELLCEQTPFFTIICVNLSLRTSNKKLAQPHFHLHSHVVKKMASLRDGSETNDAIAALEQIEAVANARHHQSTPTNFTAAFPAPAPQPSSKKRSTTTKALLAPSKGIRMDEPPSAKKQKTVVTQTVKVTPPPVVVDAGKDNMEQSTSFVRYQRGDREPVFFDIGGTKTTSFDLRIQSTNADSDDFVVTVRTTL
jgi:hypothetical protein